MAENASAVTIDTGRVIHRMRGGLGASWHAIGPTPFYYPDVINRNNRACRGSVFGGNPPPRPEYDGAWDDLLRHARWLGLDFIRVEIDMRMYHPERDRFTWDNDEMRTLGRILRHCQSNHVDVYFTLQHLDVEWLAHPGVCRLQSAPRSAPDFAESYATLLERLVKADGFDCIRWVTVNNEPGMDAGWWQGPDKRPASIVPAFRALRAALDARGLPQLVLCGPDGHWLTCGEFDPHDPAAGALALHNYADHVTLDSYRECVRLARKRDVPFFIAEFGHFFMSEFEGSLMALGGPRSEAPASYAAQMLNAEKVLVGISEGVDGFNRWSFANRGDLDGQWQLVRTWNPNTWDYFPTVTPEPVPYFCYGILTRFAAKHSSVLAVAADHPDIVATALRSPRGETTIWLLNKSGHGQKISLRLAGADAPLEFRRYEVTEAAVKEPSFKMAPQATVTVAPGQSIMDAVLPARSLTAFTTFRLADDADGITREL